MKYKYLLWDLDGTLLDFLASERAALKSLFIKYGFGECSDEKIARYSKINVKYWQALERNEMTKPEFLVGRFKEFFEIEGLDASKAKEFNDDYQLALGDTIVYCDNSLELLKNFKREGYIQAAVTNGTKAAQVKKLAGSGFDKVLDYVFISEDVGIEKPNVGIFEKVIADMKIKNIKEAIMIGDSLSSDMKGGNNIGVDTCWYNPYHEIKDLDVDINYEISNLQMVKDILTD